MSGARLRALLLGIVAVAAIAIVYFAFARPERATTSVAEADKPALLLLTSLPLVFGEDFSLEAGGSPALTALRQHYRVIPISVASEAELRKGQLLLMAQPLAQPAEDLVALDAWVRRGGRLLLLADPLLEWPSEKPLGDPARPPPMFADTGLLGHWGLRLDAPDKRGLQASRLGNVAIVAGSPGRLAGQGCAISSDGFVAHCQVGKGQATVVADADFLDVADLGDRAEHNLNGLIAELGELQK